MSEETNVVDLCPDLGIREMQEDAHNTALEKGFWDLEKNIRLIELGKLMLVVCELAEAAEEIRKVPAKESIYYVDGKPEGEGIELADTIIRIGDYAQKRNIDLTECIRIKREYNRTRPYMHGRSS